MRSDNPVYQKSHEESKQKVADKGYIAFIEAHNKMEQHEEQGLGFQYYALHSCGPDMFLVAMKAMMEHLGIENADEILKHGYKPK